MSQLAKAAGLHTTTVASLIFQDRETEPHVVERVAEALNLDVQIVSEWAGIHRPISAPYVPPPEANLLSARQRKAITELIRSFTQSVSEPTPIRRLQAVPDENKIAADKGQRDPGIGPEDEPTDTP